MRFLKFNKKAAAIGLAVGLTLGMGGVAFAYFTSTGTGSGNVTVGSITATGTLTATSGTATYRTTATAAVASSASALLPSTPGTTNASFALYTWTVSNNTEAMVHLHTVTISIATTAGNVLNVGAATAPVAGCLATWFAIGTGTAAPAATNTNSTTMTVSTVTTTLAPTSVTGHLTGTYTVQLVNSTTTSQDTCQGVVPKILIHASST